MTEKGNKVDLFDLFLTVKREGGHRCVNKEKLWSLLENDLNLEQVEGNDMRVIYAEFIDVQVYNYHKCKAQVVMLHDQRLTELANTPRTLEQELEDYELFIS
ncbi:putative transcription factor & chromatin remodeling ARID family [Helianthus anomalus]